MTTHIFRMIIFNSLIALSVAIVCPSFSAVRSLPTIGDCFSFSNNLGISYEATLCEYGLDCNFVENSNSKCQTPPKFNRFPGDYCFLNSNCISQSCKGNICVATSKKNQKCDYTFNCTQGFYCSSNKLCVPQVSQGNYCNSTFECVNSCECDNGLCVQMFSLNIGAITNVYDSNGFSKTCLFGYAVQNPDTGQYVCGYAPITSSLETILWNGFAICPTSGICASSGKSTKDCVCTIDSSQNSICPLFEGDDLVVSMITYWKILNSFNSKCHSQSRYSYNCFYNLGSKAIKAFLDFYQYYHYYYYPNISSWESAYGSVLANVVPGILNIEKQSQYLRWRKDQCPIYIYPSYPYNFTVNQCSFYIKDVYQMNVIDTYYLKPCPPNYKCNFNIYADSYCSPVSSSRYPGDYCNKTLPCYSGVCKNHTCQGQNVSDSCSSSSHCNPGFFCSYFEVCKPVLRDGESCLESYECKTLSVCELDKCIKMYSIANGKQGTLVHKDQNFGWSITCSSGFAVKNLITNTVTCQPAPKANPYHTYDNNTFVYCFDTSEQYLVPFTCQYDGIIKCPAFEGDVNLQNAISNYKALQSFNVSCSQDKGLTADCVSRNLTHLLTYYYAYTNQTLYQNYSQITQANQSIIKIMFPEYWSALQFISKPAFNISVDNSSSYSRIVLGILAILF